VLLMTMVGTQRSVDAMVGYFLPIDIRIMTLSLMSSTYKLPRALSHDFAIVISICRVQRDENKS
jgi:hypothetical protein